MSENAIERVLALCNYWDTLTKAESSTTRQIREAIEGSLEVEITQPILFGEPCD